LNPGVEVQGIQIPVEAGQKNIRLGVWILLQNGSYYQEIVSEDFRNENGPNLKWVLKKGDSIVEKHGYE
jgi:hypothetical protein